MYYLGLQAALFFLEKAGQVLEPLKHLPQGEHK